VARGEDPVGGSIDLEMLHARLGARFALARPDALALRHPDTLGLLDRLAELAADAAFQAYELRGRTWSRRADSNR